ncbi:MAG: exosortase/archaeosortase family protein [Candidatus Diapherotrites archaeon]|nr:exosortase/archaeosortase family protein [Candidatus Diapherotrites archaeon]
MNSKKKIVVFLIKFFAIFALFHYFLLVVNLSFFEDAIAGFQARLLGLGFEKNSVFAKDGAFLITSSCTGLVSTIILGAIIFSLKKPSRKEKIWIFFGGTALLLIVNQFRLYFVLLIGKIFGVQAAELAHIASWFATTAAIIFAWYYFTKKMTKTKNFEGFL